LSFISDSFDYEAKTFGITGTDGEAAMKAMRYSFVIGVWWVLSVSIPIISCKR
jgi:hypothetical protein